MNITYSTALTHHLITTKKKPNDLHFKSLGTLLFFFFFFFWIGCFLPVKTTRAFICGTIKISYFAQSCYQHSPRTKRKLFRGHVLLLQHCIFILQLASYLFLCWMEFFLRKKKQLPPPLPSPTLSLRSPLTERRRWNCSTTKKKPFWISPYKPFFFTVTERKGAVLVWSKFPQIFNVFFFFVLISGIKHLRDLGLADTRHDGIDVPIAVKIFKKEKNKTIYFLRRASSCAQYCVCLKGRVGNRFYDDVTCKLTVFFFFKSFWNHWASFLLFTLFLKKKGMDWWFVWPSWCYLLRSYHLRNWVENGLKVSIDAVFFFFFVDVFSQSVYRYTYIYAGIYMYI